MLSYLVTGLVAVGAAVVAPKSGFYQDWRLRRKWQALMLDKKIANSSGKTFKIKSLKDTADNKTILTLKVPVGLTVENLESIKTNLEYTLFGDVEMKWEKYKGEIIITVAKKQQNKQK